MNTEKYYLKLVETKNFKLLFSDLQQDANFKGLTCPFISWCCSEISRLREAREVMNSLAIVDICNRPAYVEREIHSIEKKRIAELLTEAKKVIDTGKSKSAYIECIDMAKLSIAGFLNEAVQEKQDIYLLYLYMADAIRLSNGAYYMEKVEGVLQKFITDYILSDVGIWNRTLYLLSRKWRGMSPDVLPKTWRGYTK